MSWTSRAQQVAQPLSARHQSAADQLTEFHETLIDDGHMDLAALSTAADAALSFEFGQLPGEICGGEPGSRQKFGGGKFSLHQVAEDLEATLGAQGAEPLSDALKEFITQGLSVGGLRVWSWICREVDV